jgi:hypothetical protein
MRVTEYLPSTGYLRPDAATMAELLAIVKKNLWVSLGGVTADEFRRAMFWTGHVFRLPPGEVSGEMDFPSWINVCNNFLQTCNLRDINGAAVIAGILGQADIDYRLASPRLGQVIELGIHRYVGRPCSNAWRLLNREPLRAPLGPKGGVRAPSDAIPRPKHFVDDGAGVMKEFDPGKPVWMR